MSRGLHALLSRLKACVLPDTTRRPRRLHRLSMIEPLEERMMLAANLYGSYFETPYLPFSGTWQPGNVISATYRISNGGDFATPGGFSMSFFLSRDSVIGDGSDVWLGTTRFEYSLYAGYTTYDQYFYGYLPDANNAIWNGNGEYHLGMVIDIYNEVYEAYEFDNANFGTGWDRDYLYISAGSGGSSVDLVSSSIVLSNSGPQQPGNTVQATHVIVNQGPGNIGAYEVGYYLSRDPYWDAQDAFLAQPLLTNLGGYSSIYSLTNLTLPAASHPIYQSGVTQYYIVTVLDPSNFIAESNELNNKNQGYAIDAAPVTIQGSTTPPDVDLPEVTLPTGKLFSLYLDTTAKMYKNLEKEYVKTASKSSDIINWNPLLDRIRNVRSTLDRLRAELKSLKMTGSVQLGASGDATWDATTVNYIERGLAYLYGPETQSSSRARAARDDDSYMKKVIQGVKNTFNGKEAYDTATKVLVNVGVAAGIGALLLSTTPAGLPLAAVSALAFGAAAISNTIGNMYEQGRKKIESSEPNEFREYRAPELRNSLDVLDNNNQEAAGHLSNNTPLGDALKDFADASSQLHQEWDHNTADQIDAKFDELADRLSGKGNPNNPDPDPDPDDGDLAGKYKGTYFFEVPLSNGSVLRDQADMSLKLKTDRSGNLTGKINAPFLTFDPNTLDVKSRGRIKGTFTAQTMPGMLLGNVEYKTPNGTINSTLTWMVQPDGSLRGKPSDNTESNSYFEMRPV